MQADEAAIALLPRYIERYNQRFAWSAFKDAWADSYRHTPHGKQVELRAI